MLKSCLFFSWFMKLRGFKVICFTLQFTTTSNKSSVLLIIDLKRSPVLTSLPRCSCPSEWAVILVGWWGRAVGVVTPHADQMISFPLINKKTK